MFSVEKRKSYLYFPVPATSSNFLALEKVFSAAWEAGIIDVVIVLAGTVSHVYHYIPIHEHSGSDLSRSHPFTDHFLGPKLKCSHR